MNYLKTSRLYTHQKLNLKPLKTLFATSNSVNIEEFQQKAFYPELPLLLSDNANITDTISQNLSLPATRKWFTNSVSASGERSVILSREYLNPYDSTILPYEMMGPLHKSLINLLRTIKGADGFAGCTEQFHQFQAPFALMLNCRIKGLYIAQAPLTDLPSQLQHDFPTPRIVAKAGRGDIYNANIWIGYPPTYTPLHRDPNPNLFIQLIGIKKVRLFKPDIGLRIFQKVQRNIGEVEHNGVIRGREMMEGAERKELEKIIWGPSVDYSLDGMEVIVKSGDSLFIPKGWWHSIKGLQDADPKGINASVNWWFR
ncbi:hypothetical protein EV44_g4820 [Erysiphe necator]|uniref:JmjC domain-containing protein n=1 Tax=Uncinula necator TaxID=52586 RepID=A0A0B1NZ53_UNCNE|nr:hypothetical protein EV44_g4820 [Erysiphe necator]